jgi:hypothetical protein
VSLETPISGICSVANANYDLLSKLLTPVINNGNLRDTLVRLYYAENQFLFGEAIVKAS